MYKGQEGVNFWVIVVDVSECFLSGKSVIHMHAMCRGWVWDNIRNLVWTKIFFP
jgi:hypothetical protein